MLLYRPTAGRLVQKGCSYPHEEGPALDSMLPSLGNQPARMTSTGKVPSTSAFAPPLLKTVRDLILMLFCVVLYFHAKILLYLNVFILLNVFKILVVIS